MVCKFLDSVFVFLHGMQLRSGSFSYLLERMDLRNCAFPLVGLRIAFSIWQPALIRIRSGKD